MKLFLRVIIVISTLCAIYYATSIVDLITHREKYDRSSWIYVSGTHTNYRIISNRFICDTNLSNYGAISRVIYLSGTNTNHVMRDVTIITNSK